ncbi:hypothetical protein OK016_25770 [Vibrio chagasii]|nr:hypothetical protein [Vibrio chagasii]
MAKIFWFQRKIEGEVTRAFITYSQPTQEINFNSFEQRLRLWWSAVKKSPLNKTDYDNFEPRDAVRIPPVRHHGRTL